MSRPRGRPRRVYLESPLTVIEEDDVSEEPVVYSSVSKDKDKPKDETIVLSSELAEHEAPTMADAFRILCEAMAAQLEENLPAQMHCDTMQVWYQNGPANYVTCWRHAVLVLEGIVGASLRG